MKTAHKAFALSLSFHTLMALSALWVLEHRELPRDSDIAEKKMLLVSLSAFPQPQVEAAVPPKPVVAEAPRTIEPPRPVPSQPRKQIVPEPPKQVSEPLPKSTSAAQTPSPVSQPVSAAVSAPAPAPVEKPALSAPQVAQPAQKTEPKVDRSTEKKAFYTSLRSRIQQQLRYPSAARRRGMEGSVGVRFILEPEGTIRNIAVSSGENIFHHAATQAVAAASGIAVPDVLRGDFPNTIELVLEFRLRENS